MQTKESERDRTPIGAEDRTRHRRRRRPGRGDRARLAAAGACVTASISTRNERAARRRRSTSNSQAIAIGCDVGDERAVRTAVERTLRTWDRIDIAVNCAGVDYVLGIDEMTVAQWDRVITVNLRGPFLVAKAVFQSYEAVGQRRYRQRGLDGRPACLGERLRLRVEMGSGRIQPRTRGGRPRRWHPGDDDHPRRDEYPLVRPRSKGSRSPIKAICKTLRCRRHHRLRRGCAAARPCGRC